MDTSNDRDPGTLGRQLASADGASRAEAAELLARAGAAAIVAVVPLVKACGDKDEQVRDWAVAAVEELGPPPVESIADLSRLVTAEEPLTGYWATTLLGRAGKNAASATPVLAAAVESAGDPAVRQRAAWALGKIGPAAAAARGSLERAATAGDERLARLAREALAAIGPTA
jgi:HEAT repeat protein